MLRRFSGLARELLPLLKSASLQSGALQFWLSFEGYKHARAIQRERGHGNQAFVAMWFHPQMRPIFDEGFAPALVDTGYVPYRVDLERRRRPAKETDGSDPRARVRRGVEPRAVMTARGLVPMNVLLIHIISTMFVPMISIVLVVLETLALLLSLAVEFLDHLRVAGGQEHFG
jgi:hypothetical protein